MIPFIDKIINGLKTDREIIRENRHEIREKNIEIMRTVTSACSIILTISFINSFYAILVIISTIVYLILRFYKNANDVIMLYVINIVAFVYGFMVSAFTLPDSTTVTFITVLFMAATIYIDEAWRLNTFIACGTLLFLYAISYFKPYDNFSAEVVNTLTVAILSLLIGNIVRSARLESFEVRKKLHYQAYTDQLTGISNRRMLFEMLGTCENIERKKKLTAFSLIDIDYFKLYNDNYGHQMGDECLRLIGQCFLNLQKRFDIHFYRYGGEEFVLVYYGYSKESVLAKEIDKAHIEHDASNFKKVTLSIGTEMIKEDDILRYESVITRADIALYKAKYSGRNKALFYNESMANLDEEIKSSIRQR